MRIRHSMLLAAVVAVVGTTGLGVHSQDSLERGLIARWPFTRDAQAFEAGKNATYDYELALGWRHITVQRGQMRLCLFVDGKPVAQSSPFEPGQFDLTNTAPLSIGHGPQDVFNGQMKDVRIYDRALTESEVQALAQP